LKKTGHASALLSWKAPASNKPLEYYLVIVTWKDTLVGAEADLAREQGMKCAHGFNETGTDFMNEV
jgi:hypothetical protein